MEWELLITGLTVAQAYHRCQRGIGGGIPEIYAACRVFAPTIRYLNRYFHR